MANHRRGEFVLWLGLYNQDIGNWVIKCQEWFENNCLYLEPKVREAFLVAYSAAGIQEQLRAGGANATLLMENWSKIGEFPATLFEAIQLPPLTELEQQKIIPEIPDEKKMGSDFP